MHLKKVFCLVKVDVAGVGENYVAYTEALLFTGTLSAPTGHIVQTRSHTACEKEWGNNNQLCVPYVFYAAQRCMCSVKHVFHYNGS